LITLAWRNLWRHKRRSLVTAGAVAVVTFMSVAYYGMGGAAENGVYQQLTETGGHVQVRVPGWRDARSLDDALIENAAEVRSRVEAIAQTMLDAPLVLGVLDVPALLSGEERSRGTALHGQDWPAAAIERRVGSGTVDGRMPEADDELVLGATLARALDVQPGDEVFAYAPGGEGLGAAVFTLVGVVDLADPNAEIAAAWTSLGATQALAAPDAVQRIEVHGLELVHLSEDTVADALAARLASELPELEALSWREVSPGMANLLRTIQPMLFVVSALFFLLAGMLVLNTVYLSVMERIREFGILHALGAGDRRVLSMIALESVLMCLLGTAVGASGGLALVAAYADGLVIEPLVEYYASFGMDPVFYLSVTPGQVAFAVAFALVTAVAAALWPAWIASRLEPVEAMRFQA
jgi:ABC-type lipoprotein release transport system permease subunit